jgi:hypothetical protein
MSNENDSSREPPSHGGLDLARLLACPVVHWLYMVSWSQVATARRIPDSRLEPKNNGTDSAAAPKNPASGSPDLWWNVDTAALSAEGLKCVPRRRQDRLWKAVRLHCDDKIGHPPVTNDISHVPL